MKKISHWVVLTLLVASSSACLLKKDDSGTSDGDGVSEGVNEGTTPGGASATPTPSGMYCRDTNGGDRITDYPVFFVSSIGGSFLTSVTVYLNLHDTNGPLANTGTSYVTSMSLAAYTCGSPSSLGSLVSTATASPALNGGSKAVTFTFSSPLAIPASGACGGNPNVFSFKLTGTPPASTTIYGESTAISSSCFAAFSTSSTADIAGYRGWSAIISTTP